MLEGDEEALNNSRSTLTGDGEALTGDGYVFNPLTAGVAYIRVFNFYKHIKYHHWNMWQR